jgi:hypothetical protein
MGGLTNKLGLPAPIVRAVERDPYDRGRSDYTCTQLVGPPRLSVLRRRHAAEITEDVADRIYSLIGQSVHTILERAAMEGALAEKRLYMDVDGLAISGQLDHYVYVGGTLSDYKVTSIWADLAKPDWLMQLNFLALLLRHNGYDVQKLEIAAIFRDWSKVKAKNDPGYPQLPVAVVPFAMWSHDEAMARLRERIDVHCQAEIVLPECTAEERWLRDDSWAVTKPGAKRAAALHPMKGMAEADAATRGAPYVVEHRPGVNVRCESFCPAADFCEQWQALRSNAK